MSNTQPDLSGLKDGQSLAEIWIHTHYRTGEPLQIECFKWYGCLHFLDVLEKSDIGYLEECIEGLPLEKPFWAIVTVDKDEEWYVTDITATSPTKPKVIATAADDIEKGVAYAKKNNKPIRWLERPETVNKVVKAADKLFPLVEACSRIDKRVEVSELEKFPDDYGWADIMKDVKSEFLNGVKEDAGDD